jgi:Arc/MetJ family transcription regulator
MTTITFDTLKYANRLKTAGVPEKQVEAEAEALAEVMAEAVKASDLTTKKDLHEMELRIVKWVIALALAQIGLLVGILMKSH